MKKGFTLVELLAVIIILAVVALISTPIILNVVEDAKKSAAESEGRMVLTGVKSYCETSKMKAEMLEDYEYECKKSDDETADEFKARVATIAGVSSDKITVTTNTNDEILKIVVDQDTYESIIYMTNSKVETNKKATYAVYSVGDDVTLTDGTTWIVVKDTDSSENEIKIMSSSNVHPNLTNETGTAMFLTSGYSIAYDDNSNVWSNSTLKAYLDSNVKTRLEASLNAAVIDITIWGVEELTALGCTATGNETDGYSALSCDDTTSWYSKVFENSFSWTKLPKSGSTDLYAWLVFGNDNGLFYDGSVNYGDGRGARPIITVSKSVISQQG